eukprot:gene1880-4975_t
MGDQLLALQQLLAHENDSDVEDNIHDSGQPAFSNPGSIGNSSLPSACQPTVSRKSQRNKESKQKYTRNHQSSKDIWDEKEVETEEHTTTQEDGRPEPKYTIRFKQAVRPEDMYLGMSGKSPSSNSCEELVVEIDLPKTEISTIDLQVRAESLYVATPDYRLELTLPQPVDDTAGKAQWISDKEQLCVTLPIKRDYEFLLS